MIASNKGDGVIIYLDNCARQIISKSLLKNNLNLNLTLPERLDSEPTWSAKYNLNVTITWKLVVTIHHFVNIVVLQWVELVFICYLCQQHELLPFSERRFLPSWVAVLNTSRKTRNYVTSSSDKLFRWKKKRAIGMPWHYSLTAIAWSASGPKMINRLALAMTNSFFLKPRHVVSTTSTYFLGKGGSWERQW